ncbi:MAG: hypothetical protein ACO1QS_16065 [Verrucomicrobiota bacterium]
MPYARLVLLAVITFALPLTTRAADQATAAKTLLTWETSARTA